MSALVALVERVARAIAHSHYDRRTWVGFGPKAERTAWLVQTGWAQFVPDALAALAATYDPQGVVPSLEDMARAYKEATSKL